MASLSVLNPCSILSRVSRKLCSSALFSSILSTFCWSWKGSMPAKTLIRFRKNQVLNCLGNDRARCSRLGNDLKKKERGGIESTSVSDTTGRAALQKSTPRLSKKLPSFREKNTFCKSLIVCVTPWSLPRGSCIARVPDFVLASNRRMHEKKGGGRCLPFADSAVPEIAIAQRPRYALCWYVSSVE